MKPYIHSVPGRLRIKIPLIKQRPEQFRDAQSVFESLVGVEKVVVNSLTGSMVINYDHHCLDPREILSTLVEHGFIEEKRAKAKNDVFNRASKKAGHAVGKAIFGWAVERALEPTGLSFLAVLI
jgi:hypothetical protein